MNKRTMLRNACRSGVSFSCARYIIANHRMDGGEKASVHDDLCRFYVTVAKGGDTDDARRDDGREALWQQIHTNTAELTDHLNVHCGFSYEAELAAYCDEWTIRFFDKFHEISMKTIEQFSVSGEPGEVKDES